MMQPQILIVDDEPDAVRGFERIFQSDPFVILSAGSGDEGLRIYQEKRPDVVVMDIRMPGGSGLETLRALRKFDPKALVILMTAYGTTQTVIEAMKSGAYDYIQKPFPVDKIRQVVREAARAAAQMRQVVSYQPLLQEEEYSDGIIGKSDAMQEVFKRIGQVAETEATVLITGESGTGKELVARAIYHHSLRSKRPFLAVNCAAIPEPLLESELFGYERGAFTGAVNRRPGKFEAADGGTIFLDEIGDMSPATQAKILRVLQNGEFERLGGNIALKVDVRVLAATNRDLEEMVRRGQFRSDLFYRLNVVRVHMPPLRDRIDDIPALVEYFARRYERDTGRKTSLRFAPDALDRLCAYRWPGNVRELENCVRTSLLTIKGETVLAQDLALDESGRSAQNRLPGMPLQPGVGVVGGVGSGYSTLAPGGALPGALGVPGIGGSGPSRPETQSLGPRQPGEAEVDALVGPLFSRLVEVRKIRPDTDLFDLVERTLVVQALNACAGNQARAARLLGISRSTLRKRMARYGLIIHTRVGPRPRTPTE